MGRVSPVHAYRAFSARQASRSLCIALTVMAMMGMRRGGASFMKCYSVFWVSGTAAFQPRIPFIYTASLSACLGVQGLVKNRKICP